MFAGVFVAHASLSESRRESHSLAGSNTRGDSAVGFVCAASADMISRFLSPNMVLWSIEMAGLGNVYVFRFDGFRGMVLLNLDDWSLVCSEYPPTSCSDVDKYSTRFSLTHSFLLVIEENYNTSKHNWSLMFTVHINTTYIMLWSTSPSLYTYFPLQLYPENRRVKIIIQSFRIQS